MRSSEGGRFSLDPVQSEVAEMSDLVQCEAEKVAGLLEAVPGDDLAHEVHPAAGEVVKLLHHPVGHVLHPGHL